MAKDTQLYVLHWESKDKPDHGIEAIYEYEGQANDACDLLKKYDTSRHWYVDAYPYKEN